MLYITLGGGFDGHHVALALDGQSIFDEGNITSSPLLDLARELPPLQPPGIKCDLEAIVRGTGRAQIDRAECSLSTGEDLYVVIYLERPDGGPARLRFSTNRSPFGFG